MFQLLASAAMLFLLADSAFAADGQSDPAAWGSDHIGKAVPEYVTGDECLFCHRDVGPSWPDNPHQTTIRRALPGLPEVQALADDAAAAANQTDFLLGSKRLVRYLKRSKAYGKLDLLSAAFDPGDKESSGDAGESSDDGQLIRTDKAHWNQQLFADRCIGCHTTAVDSETRTFAATSLDCFACHGDIVFEHTSDITKVLLSKHPQDPLVVNSICSSCHLRGGESSTTGLPYPNTFVPGDNLFRDFQVDLSDEAIDRLPVMQQHIYFNARQVSRGAATVTCIDCHSVHGNHSRQHIDLADTTICASCHVPDTGNSELLDAVRMYDAMSTHNETCDY